MGYCKILSSLYTEFVLSCNHVHLQLTIGLSLAQPVVNSSQPSMGLSILRDRGFFADDYWFWICVGALFGFSVLFNVLFVAALTYLNRKFITSFYQHLCHNKILENPHYNFSL